MAENNIYQRIVDLIGVDALERLHRHGFTVSDDSLVATFVDEHRGSNARIRETAAATMRACGLMTTRVEYRHEEGRTQLIVTHPAGDEQGLVTRIVRALRGDLGADTEEAAYDTNEVPISSKGHGVRETEPPATEPPPPPVQEPAQPSPRPPPPDVPAAAPAPPSVPQRAPVAAVVRLLSASVMGLSLAGLVKVAGGRMEETAIAAALEEGKKTGAISFYLSSDEPPVEVYTAKNGAPS